MIWLNFILIILGVGIAAVQARSYILAGDINAVFSIISSVSLALGSIPWRGSGIIKFIKICAFILALIIAAALIWLHYGYIIIGFFGDGNIEVDANLRFSVDEFLEDFRDSNSNVVFEERYDDTTIQITGKINSSSNSVLSLKPDNPDIKGNIHCYGIPEYIIESLVSNTKITVTGKIKQLDTNGLSLKECNFIAAHISIDELHKELETNGKALFNNKYKGINIQIEGIVKENIRNSRIILVSNDSNSAKCINCRGVIGADLKNIIPPASLKIRGKCSATSSMAIDFHESKIIK